MNGVVFFWRDAPHNKIGVNCFSQWFPSKFVSDGKEYCCCEQYMMAMKAKLFNDEAIYDRIMATSNPRKIKDLGRQVKNFNVAEWSKHSEEIVFNGNLCKFQQNEKMKEVLLNTGEKMLAEASPYDCIWGIGMAETDSGAENPNNWKGHNLLGKALMKVRFVLRNSF